MSKAIKSLRENLLYAFIVQIVAIPKIWYGDQRPALKHAFPDLLFSMFNEWYDRFKAQDIDYDFDELFPDLEIFIQNLEKVYAGRIFDEFKLVLVQQESRSAYNLSRHPFKYDLSIRLSKLGLEIYSHVLSGEDALEDKEKRLAKGNRA